MSGMFQRIARRHADRPDEPAPVDPAPAVDAPTERIEAVAPAQAVEQATAPEPVAQPEPAAAAAQATPAEQTTAIEPAPARSGFRARGRMRRRLRYLRKLRELQVRDLGGLVFDLRRFERNRDDLLAHKIDQVRACDDELRQLELALEERRDLRDVREPGIGGTCPRCFAIHGSADRFCSNCGAALGGAVQGPARPAHVPAAPATPPSPSAPAEASGPEPQQ